MNTNKKLLMTSAFLLTVALLAACAAPATAPPTPTPTPVPPTATPEPPTPTLVPPAAAAPEQLAVIQAWADAIYRDNVDAALAQFTDDGSYKGGYSSAIGQTLLRRLFDLFASLELKQENFDCQPQDGAVVCNYTVLHGCMAASGSEGLPMTATFTFQDGKIKSATESKWTGPEWDAYWKFEDAFFSWISVLRPEEKAQLQEFTVEGNRLFVKFCREYGNVVKTQEPATFAAAQAWVAALNSGDVDAALTLFTGEPMFTFWTDKSQGEEQTRGMFDWLAGKETQYQITNCEWMGTGVKCDVTVVDGCIAASDVPDGLHGKLTFFSHEDGTLRLVNGVLIATERNAYQTWLDAEHAWAASARADDLAQAEGYSKPAGAMAVKLCREYAETLK